MRSSKASRRSHLDIGPGDLIPLPRKKLFQRRSQWLQEAEELTKPSPAEDPVRLHALPGGVVVVERGSMASPVTNESLWKLATAIGVNVSQEDNGTLDILFTHVFQDNYQSQVYDALGVAAGSMYLGHLQHCQGWYALNNPTNAKAEADKAAVVAKSGAPAP